MNLEAILKALSAPLNVAEWATKRIDQVSAWLKKRNRIHEIDAIDHDAATFNNDSDAKRLSDAVKKYQDDVKSRS